MCFPSLGFAVVMLSVALVFVDSASFCGLEFSFYTFCKSGFVNRCCLNLDLSKNILFSPSMVIESFVGYNSLGLYPWSLSF